MAEADQPVDPPAPVWPGPPDQAWSPWPSPPVTPWGSPPLAVAVSTTAGVAGWDNERTLGPVFGVVVRALGAGRGMLSTLRIFTGGEVKQYTRLLEESRREAIDRMVESARLLGAHAVVMMRFDASDIANQLTEVVAYGTAVTLVPARQAPQ